MKPKFLLSLSIFLAAPVFQAAYSATPISWNGGTGNWQDTANWSTAVVPDINHDVTFNGSTNTDQIISLNADRMANSVTVTNTGSTTLLSGGSAKSMVIGSGGIVMNAGAGAFTIGSGDGNGVRTRLIGASTFTFSNNSGSLLWLRNTLAPADSLSGPVTLNVDGSGNTSFSEGVLNGVGAGSVFGIVKSGGGTLDLRGTAASNFSGGVTINGGRVITGANNRLGALTGTLAIDGGTLQFTENITGGTADTRHNRATTIGAGGATLEVDADKTVQSIGVISGDGQLVKTGSGTLALYTVDNTYTGGTVINGGTLEINSNSRLGAATSGLAINGATFKVSGSITTVAGQRPITLGAAGGTIEVTGNNTFRHEGAISGTGALTKTGTGTLYLVNAKSYEGGVNFNGGTVLTFNNDRLGAATAALSFDGGRLRSNGTITMNRATTLNAGGGILSAELAAHRLTQNGAISGIGGLTVDGLGVVELRGANTYQGATTVTEGTLRVFTNINSSTSVNASGTGIFSLGASNMIGDTAGMNLGAGGTFQTNNFSDMLGVLAVSGNATIDLTGTSVIQFADSSGSVWGGALSITGWSGLVDGTGAEKLNFGTSSAGLTETQLGLISFYNPAGFAEGTYSAQMLSNGQIVPGVLIPEVSSILLMMAGGAGFALRRRR